jgi:hypothetical protein
MNTDLLLSKKSCLTPLTPISRWDNARVVLGNVVDQSVNRLMLTGSAISKAFGFGKEVNAAGNGP